jgi:hypothetical protein
VLKVCFQWRDLVPEAAVSLARETETDFIEDRPLSSGSRIQPWLPSTLRNFLMPSYPVSEASTFVNRAQGVFSSKCLTLPRSMAGFST